MSRADPPRRGRPRRGPDPQRFAEILDVAAGIFLERGYDATSIQEIAEAAGMLKGSLYYYVRSKEDILFEIIRRVADAALEMVEKLDDLDAGPLEKLRVFVRAHVEFTVENLAGVSIQSRELRSLSEERRQMVAAVGDACLRRLRAILQAGQDEGVVSRDVDVPVASLAILGLLNSLTQWYRPDGRLTADLVADQLAAMIIGGVASTKALAAAGGGEGLRPPPGPLAGVLFARTGVMPADG